jgi:hypothetical protein
VDLLDVGVLASPADFRFDLLSFLLARVPDRAFDAAERRFSSRGAARLTGLCRRLWRAGTSGRFRLGLVRRFLESG